MFKYELGESAKDVITGFSGVIMARIEYFTGCNQYAISPTKLTIEGKKPEWEYFDENRVVAKKGKITLNKQNPGFDGNLPNNK